MEILIKTIPFQAVEIHSEQLKPEGNQWKILVGLTEINTKSRKPICVKISDHPRPRLKIIVTTNFHFHSSTIADLNSKEKE